MNARKLLSAGLAAAAACGLSGCVTVSSGSGKSAPASAGASVPDSWKGGTGSATPLPSASSMSAPQPSSGADSTDSATGGAKSGSVGQDISTSYYKAKVVKIADNVKASDDFETPKAGTRFEQVTISMTNNGHDALAMSDGYLTATLSGGAQLPGSYTSVSSSEVGFKNIQPGQALNGDIVFEVPQGQQIKSLTFRPLSMQHAGHEEEVTVSVQ